MITEFLCIFAVVTNGTRGLFLYLWLSIPSAILVLLFPLATNIIKQISATQICFNEKTKRVSGLSIHQDIFMSFTSFLLNSFQKIFQTELYSLFFLITGGDLVRVSGVGLIGAAERSERDLSDAV